MASNNNSGLYAAPEDAFCGPTALAAVTGVRCAQIEQHILAHRKTNKPPHGNRLSRQQLASGIRIKTVWTNEIEPIARACGWEAEECPGARTFGQFLSGRGRANGPWIVLITNHFVAVSDGLFVDTKHRVPIPIEQAPYKRTRVIRAWRMSKQLTPQQEN